MNLLKNSYIALIGTLLAILLWTSGAAYAINVAVFPVEDLSQDYNSVDEELRGFVVKVISKKGLEIIDSENIQAFMVAQHIRQLGHMQTKDIMSTRDAIKADLVVLATVCQKNDSPASLGMTIQLVRTSDGKTIWANSSALSQASEQRFLGVNTPETVDDLKPLLAEKLFAGWPADLDFTAGREMAGAQIAAVKETGYLEVDSVFFTPKVVRPGEKVKCTIRFKSPGKDTNTAKIFIKVGNRVHLASSDDGVYYNAAWVGSNAKQGSNVQVAMNSSDAKVLNQVWSGDVVDANYPVSLILDWPSGKLDESYLGAYVVDSRAPEIYFKLRGKIVNGMVSFRKELPISIFFKRNEPIKKWEFKVVNESGETVLRERGSSKPPSFKWRGQNGKNLRSESGIYTISIKVWDRAGNVGLAEEKVRLLSKKPEVTIDLTQSGEDEIIASLASLDDVPVRAWRMELWSEDSKLLKTYRGESLPVKFKLPEFDESIDKDKIACILKVTDDLGSKSFVKSENVFDQLITESEDETETQKPSEVSDDWYADF